MCDLHNREEVAEQEGPLLISDFVDEIVVAITSTRMYSAQHSRVQASLDVVQRGLTEIGDPSRPAIEIGTADGYLFHENLPMLSVSLSAPRILEPLHHLGSGGISIRRDAKRQELETFVAFLSRKKLDDVQGYSEANLVLASSGCHAVSFLPPYADVRRRAPVRGVGRPLDPSNPWGEEVKRAVVDIPVSLYQGVVDHLQDSMVRVVHGEELNIDEASGFVARILRQVGEDSTSMMKLCRYERYDTFTFGHSIRVCFLAVNFARRLTDDEDLLQRIGLSALLHDIGKAWVPFEILHTAGRLDDDAREEMSRHTEYGGEILLRMGRSDPLPVTVAFGHHTSEKGNRSYPRTVHQARQSATLKVVKLCDIFEALTSARPYKPSMTALRAYRIMMSMHEELDPALLRRFIKTTGLYPDGSRLDLSTGERGVVVRQTESLNAPIVLVERDRSGDEVPADERWEIDLRNPDSLEPIFVDEVVTEPAAHSTAA